MPGVRTLLVGGLLLATSGWARDSEGRMKLSSPSFAPQGSIPSKFTCEGSDIAPPLSWSEVPPAAKSLALIVDDPDAPDPKAPRMTWVHWVLYNLSPQAGSLAESPGGKSIPHGASEGLNDWKRTGYGGPCPPIGRHRYFFKLYALDTVLPDLGKPSKADLLKAMEGHIVGSAELIGTYEKGRK